MLCVDYLANNFNSRNIKCKNHLSNVEHDVFLTLVMLECISRGNFCILNVQRMYHKGITRDIKANDTFEFIFIRLISNDTQNSWFLIKHQNL